MSWFLTYLDVHLSKEALVKQFNSMSTTNVCIKTELCGLFSCSELVLLGSIKGY